MAKKKAANKKSETEILDEAETLMVNSDKKECI